MAKRTIIVEMNQKEVYAAIEAAAAAATLTIVSQERMLGGEVRVESLISQVGDLQGARVTFTWDQPNLK